jgi:hypothetical protein
MSSDCNSLRRFSVGIGFAAQSLKGKFNVNGNVLPENEWRSVSIRAPPAVAEFITSAKNRLAGTCMNRLRPVAYSAAIVVAR